MTSYLRIIKSRKRRINNKDPHAKSSSRAERMEAFKQSLAKADKGVPDA